MLKSGERQVATSPDGIREDHVARYRWAAKHLSGHVADIGCGVGYGASILADAGCFVTAIEQSAETVEFAREHYHRNNIQFVAGDATGLVPLLPSVDAAVCFEVIEHIEDPRPMLKSLAKSAKALLVSVPNEAKYPWHKGVAFHHRHYTKQEFNDLLAECGWVVKEWFGQHGIHSPVKKDVDGRTLVAVCVAKPKPREIAILGLGPTLNQFIDLAKGLGDPHVVADEIWGINAVGGVVQCDRIIHMDDFRVQEIRAAAKPDSNIAKMLKWMKTTTTPIYTSRAYPDYPASVEYPIADVLSDLKFDYANSTAAWAVMLAIHEGASKISCYGMDFTYPNAHQAERGRACVEFWLATAKARGIRIGMANQSTLMDAMYDRQERLYGYDTRRVILDIADDGRVYVDFEEMTPPTAEEIEARYNHSRHPNGLINGDAQ